MLREGAGREAHEVATRAEGQQTRVRELGEEDRHAVDGRDARGDGDHPGHRTQASALEAPDGRDHDGQHDRQDDRCLGQGEEGSGESGDGREEEHLAALLPPGGEVERRRGRHVHRRDVAVEEESARLLLEHVVERRGEDVAHVDVREQDGVRPAEIGRLLHGVHLEDDRQDDLEEEDRSGPDKRPADDPPGARTELPDGQIGREERDGRDELAQSHRGRAGVGDGEEGGAEDEQGQDDEAVDVGAAHPRHEVREEQEAPADGRRDRTDRVELHDTQRQQHREEQQQGPLVPLLRLVDDLGATGPAGPPASGPAARALPGGCGDRPGGGLSSRAGRRGCPSRSGTRGADRGGECLSVPTHHRTPSERRVAPRDPGTGSRESVAKRREDLDGAPTTAGEGRYAATLVAEAFPAAVSGCPASGACRACARARAGSEGSPDRIRSSEVRSVRALGRGA
ncbi:hypothetical protein ACH61_01739 [Rathayibacter tanaceti]|uniref:Uncharacterized protein n=1 Tax=Rathayibacter tanaceti TaxID=1671680 RepID=A0A166HT13_9MICO|nr:hypothetical protein ACH61_01739 [Rathayibacter tanaceti]